MARTMYMQVARDKPDGVQVLVPETMRDEGLIADIIGRTLKESGNRLAVQWNRAYHVGNGILGFQDDIGAEFWLLCIGDDGHNALRVLDSEVFRMAGVMPYRA